MLAAALIYTRVFPDQQQATSAHDFRRLSTTSDFQFTAEDCTNDTIKAKYKNTVSPPAAPRTLRWARTV